MKSYLRKSDINFYKSVFHEKVNIIFFFSCTSPFNHLYCFIFIIISEDKYKMDLQYFSKKSRKVTKKSFSTLFQDC